jgi:MFS family permease
MFQKVRNLTVESFQLLKDLNLNLKLYFGTWAVVSLVQTPLYLSTFFLIGLWVPDEAKRNTTIGLIFGLSSIIGVVGLIIAGIFSDRWRRDAFIWMGITLYIGAMIYYLFASRIADLYVISITQSIAGSLMMPAGAAMVADCTAKGTRTRIYTLMAIIQQLCTALGGVAGYFIFKYVGDRYEVSVIMPVIRICAGVIMAASFAGYFIHDKRSLQVKLDKEETAESFEEKRKNELILQKLRSCKTFKDKLRFYRTPIIIVLADFLIAFGAGISIPFLPRYFEDPTGSYGIRISELTLIFTTAPLLTAFISAIALYFGKKVGRARAIFWIELLAVGLLFCFMIFPPLSIVLVIYILRQAFMNAGWPLINAIVMDLLPSNQRATFSAIDSLAFTAFNSISQPIGGTILDNNDYYSGFRFAFLTTGLIYFVGVVMLLFIKEGSFETEDVEGITDTLIAEKPISSSKEKHTD